MDRSYDKRKEKRIERSFTLQIASAQKGPFPVWSLVIVNDISAGGATFTCEQPFQGGDRVALSFQVLDRHFECEARVVRAMPVPGKPLMDLAVVFEGLPVADRESITRFGQFLKERWR